MEMYVFGALRRQKRAFPKIESPKMCLPITPRGSGSGPHPFSQRPYFFCNIWPARGQIYGKTTKKSCKIKETLSFWAFYMGIKLNFQAVIKSAASAASLRFEIGESGSEKKCVHF